MSKPRDELLLGKQTGYPEHYSTDILCSIARKSSRDSLGISSDELPFTGVDIWNAYELSWLNAQGKPQVAFAEFHFPCESEYIIESKSFKLYLNSLNQSCFDNIDSLKAILERDLSICAGAAIEVNIDDTHDIEVGVLDNCIDDIDMVIDSYKLTPEFLSVDNDNDIVNESLSSHLLRSLCPVTGQPDWGSVVIEYCGKKINQEGLLRYIISYRQHQEFHEQCVERMFVDIMQYCQPESLLVYARYVRRGGLDINPYRSYNYSKKTKNIRLKRQ